MIRTLKESKPLRIYIMVIAFTALALGMSNDILSNYFKEVYEVTAQQRGFIEIPRETPGMILIFVVAGLSFLSDIRIAVVAQVLSFIGIMTLGFFTPTYSVMLIFIFINSMGMHLFFPLQDSIGLSLVGNDNVGHRMGQFKGITTAFMMIGYGIVFLGFRYGLFSFQAETKWVFILCGVFLLVVIIALFMLENATQDSIKTEHKIKFVFRKAYKYYYVLVIMFGVQKQMMMVFGPWVLIELLLKGPDTLAMLAMIGSFIGVFFLPRVGKWMDRFGVKTLLFADAISFIVVYGIYGVMSGMFVNDKIATVGWPIVFMYVLFIIDKMSAQLGIVRSIYLKSILVEESDLTPTLSLGISLDHVISITCAVAGGFIWLNYGPQYVFYLVASLSFVNLYVAFKVENK